MKRSKYNARKVTIDGVTFDSAKEAARWQELVLLEKAGTITNLFRQMPFQLAPAVKLHGEKRTKPAVKAIIDFVYYDNEKQRCIYEDTKGDDTDISRLKRHLLKAHHGIDVVIT